MTIKKEGVNLDYIFRAESPDYFIPWHRRGIMEM
jgi:hypothetical protein